VKRLRLALALFLVMAVALICPAVAYADDPPPVMEVGIVIVGDGVVIGVGVVGDDAELSIDGVGLDEAIADAVGGISFTGSDADLVTYQLSRWSWEWIQTHGVNLYAVLAQNIASDATQYHKIAWLEANQTQHNEAVANQGINDAFQDEYIAYLEAKFDGRYNDIEEIANHQVTALGKELYQTRLEMERQNQEQRNWLMIVSVVALALVIGLGVTIARNRRRA